MTDDDTCTCCDGPGWYGLMEHPCYCEDGIALAENSRPDWDATRSLLLAAASAASGAVTDLVEASRKATGQNLTDANQVETIGMLIDALRLALEVRAGEGDEMLLATLDRWVADNV